MNDNQIKLAELERKLQLLMSRQMQFHNEFNALQQEIAALRKAIQKDEPTQTAVINEVVKPIHKAVEINAPIQPKAEPIKPPIASRSNRDLEKFVGENLINKIGIVITILGVGWGVKYSIDNQLISPFTRMLLGYIFSAGLLGLSYYLKKKYENYSAVLLSGSMAMMYFITYFAFSSYGLIGRIPAFSLMVLFTIYTVAESLRYNKSVIAHIGLVGAYAVPFLLSDGSGNVLVLFSYMAIINTGILFIAFKRSWKSLFYSAFAFTWMICIGWMVTSYKAHLLYTGLVFFTFFFLLFLSAILIYKLYRKEEYKRLDMMMLWLNSILYYFLSLFLVDEWTHGPIIFTCILMLFFAAVGYVVFKQNEANKRLAHHLFAVAVVLISLALVIQLDKEWVTMAWALQALLLLWLATKSGISTYRNLYQCLLIVTFFSLLYDWSMSYSTDWSGKASIDFKSVFNLHFASSLVVSIALLGCTYLAVFKKEKLHQAKSEWVVLLLIRSTIVILLIAVYGTFYHEINHYWTQMFFAEYEFGLTYSLEKTNFMLGQFRNVWVFNYTMLFASVLSRVLLRMSNSSSLLRAAYIATNVLVFIFLTVELAYLSSLRASYLHHVEYASYWNLYIRYFSYLYLSALLWVCYHYTTKAENKKQGIKAFDFLLHITCLWVLSAELLHWRAMLGSADADKTGLSILWGVYALFVIVLGIIQRKSYLRIAGIVWFGITLLKLFFYDLSELSTLSKTIVLVALGVLLLIISFLYNKYKTKIFGDEI